MKRLQKSSKPRLSAVTSLCIALFLLLTGMAGRVWADGVDNVLKALPTPVYLAGEGVISHLRGFDRAGGVMQTQTVSVADMRFTHALQIEITEMAKYVHWVQLGAKNIYPVRKGNVLFLSFWMQVLKSENDTGEGLISVAFQKEWTDRAFQTTFTCACDGAWKRQYLRAVAKRAYQPGEATLRFQLGFRPQTIRIADVQFLNFGSQVALADLPVLPIGYEGMEPDAAWRKQALARIEKHRKSDITIAVTDSQGNPVAGASVSLKQTRLAFGLGAAHSAKLYHSRWFRDELPTFQNHFRRLFNRAVLPNILKWKQYPRQGKAVVMPAYNWLSKNEIPAIGVRIGKDRLASGSTTLWHAGKWKSNLTK